MGRLVARCRQRDGHAVWHGKFADALGGNPLRRLRRALPGRLRTAAAGRLPAAPGLPLPAAARRPTGKHERWLRCRTALILLPCARIVHAPASHSRKQFSQPLTRPQPNALRRVCTAEPAAPDTSRDACQWTAGQAVCTHVL